MAQTLRVPQDYIGMIVTGGKLLAAGDYELDDPALSGIEIGLLVEKGKAELLGKPDAPAPTNATPVTTTAKTLDELMAMPIDELKKYADLLQVEYGSNIGQDTLANRIIERQAQLTTKNAE